MLQELQNFIATSLVRNFSITPLVKQLNLGNVEYENIGAEEATGDDAAPADDAAAAPAEGEEGAEAAEGAEGAEGGDDMSPVQGLTMTLMLIDARIEELYNQILTELDEEKRTTAFEELTNLKVGLQFVFVFCTKFYPICFYLI